MEAGERAYLGGARGGGGPTKTVVGGGGDEKERTSVACAGAVDRTGEDGAVTAVGGGGDEREGAARVFVLFHLPNMQVSVLLRVIEVSKRKILCINGLMMDSNYLHKYRWRQLTQNEANN